MPKVPRITTTTVAPAGLVDVPSPEFTARDFGGGEAELLSAAASGLGAAADVMQKVQERRDVSKVLDAERTLVEGLSTRQPEYLLRKKTDAEGVTEQARKDWEKAYSDASAGMSTRQQELLRKRTDRQWLRHHGVVSGHEAMEGRQAAISSNAAAQSAATGFAAVNASNVTVVGEQRNEVVRLSIAQSDLAGDSDVEAEVREKQALLKFHTQVIQSLARTDPASAEDYYAEYKDDIPGEFRDDVEKIVFEATSKVKAQTAGDDAISRFDSVDAALANMRKTTKKGEQRSANKAEIKARFAEKDAQKAREQSDLLSDAIKTVKEKGRRSAVSPDDIARMDGKTLAAFDVFVENPTGPKRNSWKQYETLLKLSVSDPAAFMKKDISMEMEITETYRNKLVALQSKIRTGKSTKSYLENERVDSMLKTVYQQLELGDSSDDNAVRGDISEYVERARDYAERVEKRNLTSSELRTILYQAVVTQDKGAWFFPTKIAAQLSEEEIAEFEPEEIPENVKRQLAANIYVGQGYRLSNGRYINPNTKALAPPLSEDAILQRYRELLVERRRAFYAR